MSNEKPGRDCCGDRYESNAKRTICPCGCGLYYCSACEEEHLALWARRALKAKSNGPSFNAGVKAERARIKNAVEALRADCWDGNLAPADVLALLTERGGGEVKIK